MPRPPQKNRITPVFGTGSDYAGKPFEEAPGVLEMPCLEDLVIQGFERGAGDALLKLFKREVSNYVAALGDWPYGVFGSHYHSIAKQMDLSCRLYEQLFHWMSDRGICEWVTFEDVALPPGAGRLSV